MQPVHHNGQFRFSVHDKRDLAANVFCPAARICLHRPAERFKTFRRVVKVRDRLCQLRHRIGIQKSLKMSKRLRTLIKIFFTLRHVVSDGIRDKQIHPPPGSQTVHIIVRPGLCPDQRQRLALRISSRPDDLIPQIRRDAGYILHQAAGILKHMCVHPLQDILAALLPILCAEQKCVIDMPVSIARAL